MGVQLILPVKVSVTTDTILNLDGDFRGHIDGDVTCKQTLTIVHKNVTLKLEWDPLILDQGPIININKSKLDLKDIIYHFAKTNFAVTGNKLTKNSNGTAGGEKSGMNYVLLQLLSPW